MYNQSNFMRKQWIEALKSGKFVQTKGVLGSRDGHCCLGVACEIAGFSKELDDDGVYSYMMPDSDGWLSRKRTTLNVHQSDQLGLHTNRFYLPEYLSTELEVDGKSSWQLESLLMKLNDSGYTFEQIADLLIFDSWIKGMDQDEH